jgi:hypothetical protein
LGPKYNAFTQCLPPLLPASANEFMMPLRSLKTPLLIIAVIGIALGLCGLDRPTRRSVMAAPLGQEPGRIHPASVHSPSIVGGEEAAPEAWPWVASLIVAGVVNPVDGHFCGGALIHPDWVLTAAHCTYDGNGGALLPTDLEVILGRHQLSSNEGSRTTITQIIRHPSYDNTQADFDVALLQLATSATQTPIRLISPGEATLEAAGTTAMVTGWGLTIPGDSTSAPDRLRQVSVPIVSYRTCTFSYGLLTDVITPRMLCAGYQAGGRDSCAGDSGGPLMVYQPAEAVWVQVGVVSWGIGCAEPYYYGIYARLSQFTDWLNRQIPDLPAPQITPTPTATPLPPTPTPTPVPTTVSVKSYQHHLPLVSADTTLPLLNGDFERGSHNGWQIHTLRRALTVAISQPTADPLTPHSGRFVAWLGGTNQEVSVLEQQVTVPPRTPVLRFWYQSRSEDVCGWDYGGVVVNDQVIRRLDLCTATSSTQWRLLQVNLTAYAGQQVWLQLRAETDSFAVSSFYVDDVSWGR